MSPLGVGCAVSPFQDWVSRGSKLCNWWFWKVRSLINKFWWMWYFEETVDDGVGRTMPGRRAVSGCSPLWRVMAGQFGKRCQLFIFLLKIHGDYWQGVGMVKSVPSSTVTEAGATYALTPPPPRVSPDATHKQLLRLMILTITGSPLDMEYCWHGMKNGGDLKVLQGFWIWAWVETFPWNWILFWGVGEIQVFKIPLRWNVAARWWWSDMLRPLKVFQSWRSI